MSALISDLIEVFSCGSHLLPGFIKQLDADTEELLPCPIMSEEHGVIVVAALISYTRENISIIKLKKKQVIRIVFWKIVNLQK